MYTNFIEIRLLFADFDKLDLFAAHHILRKSQMININKVVIHLESIHILRDALKGRGESVLTSQNNT